MATVTSEHPPETRQPARDAPDVLGPYLKALQEKLADMPPAQRLPSICDERTKWLVAYARFERRMAKGKAPDPGESAATYILGIAELGKLKGAEERRAAVIPTEANHAP